MKNKYNIAAYKECAEVKVYHKVNNYSFFTEKEKRGIENAVEYTDLTNEDNYHLSLKEYDEESIWLIYEYNETISKEQLNEMIKKDLIVMSNYLYAISPEIRSGIRSRRRFLFKKEKTEIAV